uniref:NDUFA12 n=1 Tax=Euglena gracilis TaxID=3039 RepID=UPI002FE4FADD|eukprot:EG_transcript_19840
MIRTLLLRHSAPAVITGRPQWWTQAIAVPPTQAEMELFQPKEVVHTKPYKPHPWFKDFGQGRRHIVGPPERGEFWRFRKFYAVMREKTKELGVRGALRFLVRKLRTQREAWYEKGYEEDILVGEDEMGNKYWQSSYTTAVQSRWVEYGTGSTFTKDASVVAPEWYQWLHGAPDPEVQELRPRHPAALTKGLTGDYWYRMKHSESQYAFGRKYWPRGNPHPKNTKYDDFLLRKRRLSKRRGFMEFDPFVLPAERLRKRAKWAPNPVSDRRHSAYSKNLPLGA